MAGYRSRYWTAKNRRRRRTYRKRHKRFVTPARRQAPPPRLVKHAAAGAVAITKTGNQNQNAVFNLAPGNVEPLPRMNLLRINGSASIGAFISKSSSTTQHLELAFMLATPLKGNTAIDTNDVNAFNPFNDDVEYTPAQRGFNIVRLNRLAIAHPKNAPDTLHQLNRRLKKGTKRHITEGTTDIKLLMYAFGSAGAEIAISVDAGWSGYAVA